MFNPKLLALGALVLATASACASASTGGRAPPATTTVTAGAMSQTETPATDATESGGQPAGQLVCKTKAFDRAHQLFLEWNSGTATGTLRTVVPSGMVTMQPVTAQRYKGMIIVDDPNATDLVEHLARVRENNGKKDIQVGDGKQAWSTCD